MSAVESSEANMFPARGPRLAFYGAFCFLAVVAGVGCTSASHVGLPGSDAGTSQVPPADGRCGLTPQLVVPASAFPVPTDAGPVTSGVGAIIATGSDLYYTIWVLPVVSPGFGAAYFDASLLRVPMSGGQPTLIASGALFLDWVLTPTSLIVGENTSSGSDVILSVPLAGGPPTTVLTCNYCLVSGFATDGTYVYLGDTNGVEAVSLAPTSGSPAVITLTSDIPGTIAVLGQQLILALPEGGVESVPLPPLANSAVTQRGTAGAGQNDMQPCGSNVCWRSEAPNEIWQMNPASGAPTTLATLPFAEAWGLTFDGSNFYLAVTDSNSSTVKLARISADGSDPVVLVTMKNGGAHAVDDECVYWASSEGIYSLAKTARGPFNQ